jgi:hypothetical protein
MVRRWSGYVENAWIKAFGIVTIADSFAPGYHLTNLGLMRAFVIIARIRLPTVILTATRRRNLLMDLWIGKKNIKNEKI